MTDRCYRYRVRSRSRTGRRQIAVSDNFRHDGRRGGRDVSGGLPACGKTGAKVAKKRPKPKCPPKRRYEEPPADVTESSSPNDVIESPQATDNPPSDVIVTDNTETGDAAARPKTEMSDEEWSCYLNYMNKKLDVYEPMWIDDMQEFDKKYNEAMAMLEDIYTRLFDHMSLWTDEWHMLSDGEKSFFCPQSSAEIVDPAVEIADTSPAELDTPPQTETTSAFEDTAAVVPRSAVSLNHGAQTGTAASRPETGNVDDDDDDDYAASKGKDWNCYTVLIREGLAAIHLAKDKWGQTMRRLASRWRSLSDEEQETYRAEARRHNAARSLDDLQPTRQRAGRRRQLTRRGKMSLNTAEDMDEEEEHQAPPANDEDASPSDDASPEPDTEELLGGAVVEALEPLVPAVSGPADGYVSDDEKPCFEAFIASHLDSSLEVGSEQWVTAFAEKLDAGVEQWNGLSADERLGFCVGVAPRKAKCVGGKARSRSRSGRQASAKKKKRSKKGWTCYTHFFVEKLRSDGIKLTRANFADVVRDIAKQWHELSDEEWKNYKCKCKRRKPKAPAAAA